MIKKEIEFNEDEFIKFQKQASRNGLSFSGEIRRQLNLDPKEDFK